uniref:WSC domain-containing protein n=1 Tax=Macrostomum lignano TaxID=282301 RepID=A0A1I8J785_9PLAT
SSDSSGSTGSTLRSRATIATPATPNDELGSCIKPTVLQQARGTKATSKSHLRKRLSTAALTMQTLSILALILCCCIALGHSLGAEFGHLGCFVNAETRDVNGLDGWTTIGPYSVTWDKGWTVLDWSRMTLELCSEICTYEKFRYFAVQYSGGYFCGNSYGRFGRAADSDCNMACAGNSAQMCGGTSRNSVYRQVYNRSDSKHFILADRDYVNVTSTSGPFYRTEQPVRSLIECVYRCVTDCQAVLFHLDACHLLRFPILPHELKDVAGMFVTRM